MGKLLVDFGATGQQGGSVLDNILHKAEFVQAVQKPAVLRATLRSLPPKL